jgi:4'-phosphopantetheinyl transferase
MWWLAHGEHEVPAGTQWLSPRERDVLARIRYTKRYVEFLTRRWTAKRALATVLRRDLAAEALATVEIAHHPGGAPYVLVDGERAAIEVSLSDRAGWAACLVGAPGAPGAPGAEPGTAGFAGRPPAGAPGAVGIDLELVEPRSDGFVEDFFTAAERERVRALPAGEARDEAANLIWSAKEAALKVLKVGLRADTREVEVEFDDSFDESPRRDDRRPLHGWAALTVRSRGGASFPGWWRRDGAFVLTVAGAGPFHPPVPLAGGGDLATAAPVHSWIARPLVAPG